MQNTRKIPLRERVGKVGYLLKNTFTVVGRDFDILNPILRMIVYGLIQATVVTLAFSFLIYAVAADAAGLWSWGWILLGAGIVLYFYKFFYNNRQEVRQSYLVYQTVMGNDHSYPDAVADSRELKSSIRGLAFIDMIMAYVNRARRSREGGGIIGGIVSMILAGLSEVWDLANHYLIPAVVIERTGLKEAIGGIKRLRNQVPETLTGVFGIDIFGSVVGALMAPIYIIAILVAGWLSFTMTGLLPAIHVPVDSGEVPGWMMHNGELTVTLIPFFVMVYIAKVFSVILERTVTAIKVMYFTIFYMQITHPDRIAEDLRGELTAYLQMEQGREQAGAPAAQPES